LQRDCWQPNRAAKAKLQKPRGVASGNAWRVGRRWGKGRSRVRGAGREVRPEEGGGGGHGGAEGALAVLVVATAGDVEGERGDLGAEGGAGGVRWGR